MCIKNINIPSIDTLIYQEYFIMVLDNVPTVTYHRIQYDIPPSSYGLTSRFSSRTPYILRAASILCTTGDELFQSHRSNTACHRTLWSALFDATLDSFRLLRVLFPVQPQRILIFTLSPTNSVMIAPLFSSFIRLGSFLFASGIPYTLSVG